MGRLGAYLLIVCGCAAIATLTCRAVRQERPAPAKPPEQLRAELSQEHPPQVRAAAAAALAAEPETASRDPDTMTALLAALEDPDPVVRGRAGAAVATILNADFYYRAEDPPERRRAAIEKIRTHWEAWIRITGGGAPAPRP